MIPSILHQTWKTSPPPREYMATWQHFNPGLECRFYDDQDCHNFVVDEFPHLVELYDSFPLAIERVDLFRYLVVYRCGGWYADLDMECLRSMRELLQVRGAVFCIEAHLTPERQKELSYRHPYQIANCIFAAEAGHPFLQGLIKCVAAWEHSPALSDERKVEDITGPRMLTRRLYQQASGRLQILPQICWLSPRWYPNIFPVNIHMYARHHFWGTWKAEPESRRTIRQRWIERDRLANPFASIDSPARPSGQE